MPLVDPTFRILPNPVDGIRRSTDRLGEAYWSPAHAAGSVSVQGQVHEFGLNPGAPIVLNHAAGAINIQGRTHEFRAGLSLDHAAGQVAVQGQDHIFGLAPASINVGTLSQDAVTPEQIALYLPTTGAVDQATTATVEYRISGAGVYLDAQPLWRIQPQYTSATPADAFSGVIFGLIPGNSYDVRVTVTEPGVGSVVLTETFTTRALPAASGAATTSVTTEAELNAAISAASPGDVIEITAGFTVTSAIVIAGLQGTAANPIVIRGSDRDAIVLDYPLDARLFRLDNCAHIVFENFTHRGSSAAGTGSSMFLNSRQLTGVNDSITVRNMRVEGVDHFVFADNSTDATNFLLYDNIVDGNNQYESDGGWGTVSTSNAVWDDDGVKLGGRGHCIFNNDLSYFGDTIAVQHGPSSLASESRAIFAYRNKIKYSGDDAVEFDYSERNNAFYDNYVLNCATAISVDGIYGGPVYAFRNRFINIRRFQMKCGDEATGMLLYNNTWVHTEGDAASDQRRGWYMSGAGFPRDWEYRNNLVLWEGGSDIFRFDGPLSDFTPWVCTNNGWGRNSTNMVYAGTGLNVSGSVATVNAAVSPIHDGDVEITNQAAVFGTPVALGANWETAITTEYSLELSAGSEAIGVGVSLPNINSGTNIGADQGALPAVGNRYANGAAPTPDTTPAYIAALSAFESTQLGTAANGNETLLEVTPSSWLVPNNPSSGPGASSEPEIIPAWCGGAGFWYWLIVHGGGHNDDANNGVYLVNFSGDVWEGITLPFISDVAQVPAPGAPIDLYNDGNPAAVHTYQAMAYINGVFLRFGGARYGSASDGFSNVYSWDGTSWTQEAGFPWSGGPNSRYCGAGANHTARAVLVNQRNQFDCAIFDVDTRTWGPVFTSAFAPTNYPCNTVNENTGEVFGVDGNIGFFAYQVDWDTNTITSAQLISTVGDSISFAQGMSILWDGSRDSYWVFGGGDNVSSFNTIYEISGTGSTRTVTATALTGTVPSGQTSRGMFNRATIMDAWRAIGCVMHSQQPPHVFRLPGRTSIQFNGNSADTGSDLTDRVRVRVAETNNPANIGAGDFTTQFWVCMLPGSNNNGNTIVTGAGNAWTGSHIIKDHDVKGSSAGGFGYGFAGGYPVFGSGNTSGAANNFTLVAEIDLRDGLWHYMEFNRQGGTQRIFVDGVLRASTTSGPTGDMSIPVGVSETGDPNSNLPRNNPDDSENPNIVIGAEKHGFSGDIAFYGWMYDLRDSNIVRNTSDYTPPTEPMPTDANTTLHWRLNDEDRAFDLTGNGNHGEWRVSSPDYPRRVTEAPF